jgi:uncharacterized membrane protein YeaQ/YmgE (transglycosylase-associated protein family)
MGILSWIVLGFLAGTLAKALVPGRDPSGCIVTIVLGVVGALVGGWIGTQLGWGSVSQFNLAGIGLATLGAAVVLLLYRLVERT